MTTPTPEQCEGPLIWYDAGPAAAILECARPECDYLIVDGNFNDARHGLTPILREGLAS